MHQRYQVIPITSRHATTPNCRSEIIDHLKIYFINFGAIYLKIWILYHLNYFLEIIF